jgi:Gram-negative bacterial TonB protein C-terminal
MRELLLILAMASTCALAQSPISLPPAELDRAVMQERPHIAARVEVFPAASDRMEANYSDEGRIAGLEGTVRLTAVIAAGGTARDVEILQPLGLGLDQEAIEAAKQGHNGVAGFSTSFLHADFTLPQKGSRWHLVSVAFFPPEGASRPKFAATRYPQGASLVGGDAIDHGEVVAALGRQIWVAVAFDIDEGGIPVHLSAMNSTDDLWATQSMAFIREWRFKPALVEGEPVAARCVVGLTWGPGDIDANRLSQLRTMIERAVPLLGP